MKTSVFNLGFAADVGSWEVDGVGKMSAVFGCDWNLTELK